MYYQKASMCFKCCNAKRNKRPFPVSSLVLKSWTSESHSDQDSPGSWGPAGSLARGWLSDPGGTSLTSQAQSPGWVERTGQLCDRQSRAPLSGGLSPGMAPFPACLGEFCLFLLGPAPTPPPPESLAWLVLPYIKGSYARLAQGSSRLCQP